MITHDHDMITRDLDMIIVLKIHCTLSANQKRKSEFNVY